MKPLTPGTYVWDEVIRFRTDKPFVEAAGSDDAEMHTAHLKLAYTVSD